MTRWECQVVAAVVIRPWLWRSALRFVPNGWWHWPPSLRPPEDYMHFRIVTAYRDPAYRPPVSEIIKVLHWCRRAGRLR